MYELRACGTAQHSPSSHAVLPCAGKHPSRGGQTHGDDGKQWQLLSDGGAGPFTDQWPANTAVGGGT
jgi:hypothetical protein